MSRFLLALAVGLAAGESAIAQVPRFIHPPGRVSVVGGRRGVSVSVGSPWGGYSGFFPVPRAYDPYLYGRSYDGYVSPYGTYYDPQSGYVDHYLPPVNYPAELMYGPLAMRQFMGLNRIPLPPEAAARAVAPPAEAPAEVIEGLPEPVALPAAVRESNAASRERAAHFLDAGDNLFREQKHHDALQRYKSAAQAAPDVADAYFRQGFALTATNRYELAAEAFRRGLALDPDWPASAFRLDTLYGEAALAKRAHQDALANAALHDPENADLMFVLGVFLHCDGQRDRAQKFFVRARELDGDRAASLDGFFAAAP